MESWKEELYHHGIPGQQWGVRNGPPYPLSTKGTHGKEKQLVKYANKEVKRQMDKETKQYVKDQYNSRYADNKALDLNEYIQRRKDLEEEFRNSDEYQDLMSQKYTSILESGKEQIAAGKRHTAAQIAAAVGLIYVGGKILKRARG